MVRKFQYGPRGAHRPTSVGGQYCENCQVGKIVPNDVTLSTVSEGVRSYALEPKNAEALWKKNEEMVGELLLKDDGKSAVMPESR
jgi:hypothetical protein